MNSWAIVKGTGSSWAEPEVPRVANAVRTRAEEAWFCPEEGLGVGGTDRWHQTDYGRGVMRRRVLPTVTWLWLSTTSCGEPHVPQASRAGVGPLAEASRIELEELPGDPIVGIDYVGRRPGGGYLVADRFAGHVRLFDEAGRQTRVVGRPGQGPGELDEPGAAVEFPDGRVIVLQRANPRLTIFRPDSTPAISTLPGQYGFWAEAAGDGFVAGVATRDTRFARFSRSGQVISTFGRRDPSIATTPFWIYFAADHAAVLGEVIAVNTSLYPTLRLFSLDGDSLTSFGSPPPDWAPVTVPPVSDLSARGNRQRLEAWARTFTVVRQVAAVADSLLVVEYGRHDPQESDPDRVVPTTADVYSPRGEKLAEGIELPGPVVGGGAQLLVLVSEPPSAWTIAAFEWVGPER